jgi:hypothetical protein
MRPQSKRKAYGLIGTLPIPATLVRCWAVTIALPPKARTSQPHELAVMTAAFEEALHKLGLKDRADKAVELVARRIINLAKRGDRDPAKLCEDVLKSLNADAAGSSPGEAVGGGLGG